MFDFNPVIMKHKTPLKRFPSLSAPIGDPPTYSSLFCYSNQRSALNFQKYFHFLSKVLRMKKHKIFPDVNFLNNLRDGSFISWKVCKQIKMCIEKARHTSKHQPNTPLCDTSVYLASLKSHACLQRPFLCETGNFLACFFW